MRELPETSFLKDVRQQPASLRSLVAICRQTSVLDQFERLARGSRLVFLGMGSSLYAPYGACLELAQHGLWAERLDASEALHYRPGPPPGDVLPVLVSQSGESIELVRLADRWKSGYVAITNDPASALARSARLTLPLSAGTESAASSRTYVNTVALALLVAGSVLHRAEETLDRIERAAEALERALTADPAPILGMADHLGRPATVDVVGRGPGLGLAQQSALILRETTGTPCAALSMGLLRHGPIHAIGPESSVLAFVGTGRTEGLGFGLVADLLVRGARVAVVTDSDRAPEAPGAVVVRVPPVDESLFPIVGIAPVELLACFWAARDGVIPGEDVEKVTRVE